MKIIIIVFLKSLDEVNKELFPECKPSHQNSEGKIGSEGIYFKGSRDLNFHCAT